MNAGGHLAFAGVAWCGYAALVTGQPLGVISSPEWAIGIVPALVGGLLPDIDHPRSTFGSKIRPVSTILSLFSHRGITHSLWAIVAMFWLLLQLPASMIWAHALVLGFLTHLACDASTPAGLRPFWPLEFRFNINPLIVWLAFGGTIYALGA